MKKITRIIGLTINAIGFLGFFAVAENALLQLLGMAASAGLFVAGSYIAGINPFKADEDNA